MLRIMLVMSVACAASGIVLDLRVKGLLASARAGTVMQSQLERADEVATLLLFFSLSINGAAMLLALLWASVAHAASSPVRTRLFVALAAMAIPAANPIAPFLVRALESGLDYAILARALGIAAAAAAFVLVRRLTSGPRLRVGPDPAASPG